MAGERCGDRGVVCGRRAWQTEHVDLPGEQRCEELGFSPRAGKVPLAGCLGHRDHEQPPAARVERGRRLWRSARTVGVFEETTRSTTVAGVVVAARR